MTTCEFSPTFLFFGISYVLIGVTAIIFLIIAIPTVLFPRHNSVKELRKLYEKRKKERAKKHKEFANILNRKVNDNK
jgi:hypothetical protein